jgi:hypothetical protein
MLGGQILSHLRCSTGATAIGCTEQRWVEGGTCDTDCQEPTETPTPTPTATVLACSGSTRFWVGGAGDANDSLHWACESNGAGGASVPACVTAGDTFQGVNDCVWDANSGFADPQNPGDAVNIHNTGLC